MTTQYIEHLNGNTYYYSDRDMTILHREDGPALIWSDGYEAHYIDNKRHNPKGAAITSARGYKEWWIDGKELTEAEFNALTKPNPNSRTFEIVRGKITGTIYSAETYDGSRPEIWERITVMEVLK
jgi:hypothetical protein